MQFRITRRLWPPGCRLATARGHRLHRPNWRSTWSPSRQWPPRALSSQWP